MEHEELGAWLRHQREARCWSRPEMARQLIKAAHAADDRSMTEVGNLCHNIYRWERGAGSDFRRRRSAGRLAAPKAWRESLREAGWRDIRDQTTWSPDAFMPHVYQQYVSGKPRMASALAALDYFHVPDAEKRVAEYAQRKQEMVVRLIEAGDFTAYPDALRFVIATKDAGMRVADASSSKNAGLFLRKIRLDTFAAEHGISSPTLTSGQTLLDYFDVDVSGAISPAASRTPRSS